MAWLQMSPVLIQYHKQFLVIFLYIHVYGLFSWLEMKKKIPKRSKPDFSIFSCKVHRKKWWMMGHECLHSLLFWNWQITLCGLESRHGARYMCAYESLWKKNLKLGTWSAMCKQLSGSWVWTYYYGDVLLD